MKTPLISTLMVVCLALGGYFITSSALQSSRDPYVEVRRPFVRGHILCGFDIGQSGGTRAQAIEMCGVDHIGDLEAEYGR